MKILVFNDLSLGEIAKDEGISRQGVHGDGADAVTGRSKATRRSCILVAKFLSAKQKASKIDILAKQFHESLKIRF